MSQSNAISGQFRLRAPRLAESTLRERLALVPPRSVRTARMPFVMLIGLILAGGVAGLLLFNTHMQQGAFEIQRLQAEAATLTATQQDESMQLLRMSDPQRLAVAAKRLGMVAPANPAFLDLATGRILGVPAQASAKGALNIGGGAAPTPAALRPAPKIVIVKAGTAKTTAGAAKTQLGNGAASTGTGKTAGKKRG